MTGIARSTVTWTPPAASVWHDVVVINGASYPTRHPALDGVTNSHEYLDDLTDGQMDLMRAIHEAAHAVAGLAAGAYVHDALISVTGELRADTDEVLGGAARVCNIPNGLHFITIMGAGERANDRWLHEAGLWTPFRAAGAELGAYGDRRNILRVNPHLGFAGGTNDYLVVHHVADQFVDEHWDRITTVGAVLAERLYLTGDEVADLAGLPNGTHAATCTY